MFRWLHFNNNLSVMQVAIVTMCDTNGTCWLPLFRTAFRKELFLYIIVFYKNNGQSNTSKEQFHTFYLHIKPRSAGFRSSQQLIWNLLLPEAKPSSENSIITAKISCGAVWQFSFATARWMDWRLLSVRLTHTHTVKEREWKRKFNEWQYWIQNIALKISQSNMIRAKLVQS